MTNFDTHIIRGVGRGTAWVVTADDPVTGAMLLSGAPAQAIPWLAVHPSHRRQGVGGALIEAAVSYWRGGDIAVVTLAEDNPAGLDARRFYERYGFSCRGAAPTAPDGSRRDLFLLSR